MSKQFKPLLAEKADLSTIRFPLIASPKIDGIRCVILPALGPVSRKLKPIPNRHIRDILASMDLTGVDGEIVTLDRSRRIKDFNAIQSDVMSEDGTPDFMLIAFDDCSNPDSGYATGYLDLYAGHGDKVSDRFKLIENTRIKSMEDLDAYEQACVDLGWEGIMVRDPSGRYKFGRSTAREQILLKIKRFEDDEAEIIGFIERMHNTNAAETDELGHTKRSSAKEGLVPTGTLGALSVAWRGTTFEIGTGFNDEQRADIWRRRDSLIGKTVTFAFQGIGSQGRPRFPSFKGLRSALDLAA